jgi:phenylacetate-CoA ligase
LIRYSLDDYAEVGESCDCGRGLPVLKRILGRSRNMMVLPDTSKRWPVVGALTIADVAPVEQIQVIQHTLELVEAKLVTRRNFTKNEEQKVIQVLQESLGYPFDINLTFVDEIPRSKSGKFETFICLVESG